MKRALRVYAECVKINISASLAYRGNFFLETLLMIGGNLLVPLVTVLIYQGGAAFPGWSFHEALLIQSVFMLSTGLCSPLFYSMVWITMEEIRNGTYDLFLLRPGSIIWYTIARSFNLESFGGFIGGLFMFIYALSKLPAPPAAGWVLFLILFLLGIVLSLGFSLIMTALMFKWVGNSRIFEMYDSITILGRYPGDIYARPVRFITSIVIPVFMLGFFPASALLRVPAWNLLWAGLPCAAFCLLGAGVFKLTVKRYQSGGG